MEFGIIWLNVQNLSKNVQKQLKNVQNPLKNVQNPLKNIHNLSKNKQNPKSWLKELLFLCKNPDSSWNQGFFSQHRLGVVHLYKLHRWYRRQGIHHHRKKQLPDRGLLRV